MREFGIGLGGRAIAASSLALLAVAPLHAAGVQEDEIPEAGADQERLAAEDGLAEAPAVHVAGSERAFDRLDAEAGLRSGGPFSFDYQHLVFFPFTGQPDADAPVDLWTAVSVQADRVKGVFEGGWHYSLDMRIELWQADTLAFSRDARTTMTLGAPLSPTDAAGLGFPIQTGMRIPPGTYEYRIRIRDRGWEHDRAINEVVGLITVPRRVLTQPFVSSIAVAADSGGTWRPAPDLELKLNAARIVHDDARPFVYFEAYGLTPGGDYRGEVRLVSRRTTRGADDVFDGAYQPYQLQYRGSVPDDQSVPVRKVLRLDLGQTRPGPYELQVRVRDLVTGHASEVRTARLKVRERETYVPLMPVAGVDGDE